MQRSFRTPAIPISIRELKAPIGYVNPFQIGIVGPNLYGTETLCGDWTGDLLLLAQDFAPARLVMEVKDDLGAQQAWRHNDGDGRYRRLGLATNINICRLLTGIGRRVALDGRDAMNCKTLYGSACFFLSMEGKAPNSQALAASEEVFHFVRSNMPSLRAVACLGAPSFESVAGWMGRAVSWREQLDSEEPIRMGGTRVFAMSHPGQRGTNNRLPAGRSYIEKVEAVRRDWFRLSRVLQS